jgi:hypothetical protein
MTMGDLLRRGSISRALQLPWHTTIIWMAAAVGYGRHGGIRAP